eukprot:g24366.t1
MDELCDRLASALKITDVKRLNDIKALLYADDVALIAHSRTELQKMVNVVAKFAEDYRLEVNLKPGKTEIMPVYTSSKAKRPSCLGRFLGNVSSFLANSEPSPTRNQEVQSGVEEPTIKNWEGVLWTSPPELSGQPDHSTIPVISSSEVCTDSESDHGEDLATARGLQEYKRWRTRRPKKTTQSLRRKPYGNDGTTRNLRHDYCTMPGQRIIQDEKLVRDTLLKSCGCTRKCMTQINASQIMLLRSGYCALGSRAAQNDYLKLLARDFKKLSDHDERLQPHLSLPNSPPIEVCQEAFLSCVCRVSRDKLGRPIYHLSYGTEWRKMYEDRFVPWVGKHYPGADIPSESEFYAVHENPDFLFITFICQVKTKTPEKKKSAMEADLHDKMVDIDHTWYIMDKAFCERHPDKKSCIAVDQTTLEQGIPSHHPPKTLFDRKSKLEVNFGGGINFSISQENHIKYFFVYFSHFTKDANLVLTQLFFMIWAQLTSDFAASRSAELRIHVDNTAAENKNQWLFSFAGWLLLLLLFKKVFLTFLPVGHTGNEVDSSVFGSVKDKCKVSDIVCLFDIFKVAKEGLTKPNQLIYLRSVLDFRSFFQPHLLGIQRTMEGRYFEFQLSDSRRSDGSRFPVVRGKKCLNELAEFGEWIPFMDGNPQGMPKPAPPTLDILPDNVKKTLKKLLRHPLLIKGEDRSEWIENFLATRGKDDGVRVIGEHEAGMVGRPGQLKISALTVDIRVVEASSLPPLNLIEAADQRITVADEAYKNMLAADDGGRLHMKLIPSSRKTFKNTRTNDQSENQSADPECLPVSATVRESQLEKVVEGMHACSHSLRSRKLCNRNLRVGNMNLSAPARGIEGPARSVCNLLELPADVWEVVFPLVSDSPAWLFAVWVWVCRRAQAIPRPPRWSSLKIGADSAPIPPARWAEWREIASVTIDKKLPVDRLLVLAQMQAAGTCVHSLLLSDIVDDDLEQAAEVKGLQMLGSRRPALETKEDGLASAGSLTGGAWCDRWLSLNRCQGVSSEALAAYLSKVKPRTLFLTRHNPFLTTPLTVATAGGCLRQLSLRGCGTLTNLNWLAPLTELQTLDLYSCISITNNALAAVGSLRNLTRLTLHDCNQLTEQGLARLSGLTSLIYLDLSFLGQLVSIWFLESLKQRNRPRWGGHFFLNL